MRRVRVIPTLLLDSTGRLVKTVRFGKRTYIGDPINAVRIFNDKGVDELILLDIDATREDREPDYELIEDIASEAFMPVGYGGGIRNLEQMNRLFRCGLEKIVVSTGAFECPGLIQSGAERFGSQSIVVCLDIKGSLFRGPRVYIRSGRRSTGLAPEAAARHAVVAGAGEIIVYSIDRDGTYTGYDLDVLRRITHTVGVPTVACGGANGIPSFSAAVSDAGCSAVAAGSLFLYQSSAQGVLINYPCESDLSSSLFSRL